MNNGLKKLYDLTPNFAQDTILTLYSIILDNERYGKTFSQHKEIMLEMERASADDITAYQTKSLSTLIKHAYETVPYYHELFKKEKLKPSDIKSIGDLEKIPVLTKELIKSNFNTLWSRKYKHKELHDGHTSGTTGTPLEVLYDSNMMGVTYAAMDRQYRWAGINFKKFGDRTATIRGNIIVPLHNKKPPFWRYNAFHRQLYLSNFHLSTQNIPHYFKKLKEFNPTAIDGYPSSLYILAKYLLNNGEKLPLSAILTSSETLYDFQRDAIESAFECKVFDYYGHAERTVFAGECAHHKGHHLFPEYGITEILDSDLKPLTTGEEGIMAGTSLQNYGMPLIRYMTNDRTALKSEKCSCGINFPLMEDVATKAEDILRLKDGRFISPSVLTHPFKPLNCIDGSQIVQTELDKITIRLIPRNDFNDTFSNQLISDLKDRLGQDMDITIEFVEELPKTKSGKFKWVISNVNLGI